MINIESNSSYKMYQRFTTSQFANIFIINRNSKFYDIFPLCTSRSDKKKLINKK